jgi:hypothetical protein
MSVWAMRPSATSANTTTRPRPAMGRRAAATDAIAVGPQHHVVVQEGGEGFEIARSGRRLERLHQAGLLTRIGIESGRSLVDVVAGPAGQLPARLRGAGSARSGS